MLNYVTGLEQRLKFESQVKSKVKIGICANLSPNFDVGTEQIKDAVI